MPKYIHLKETEAIEIGKVALGWGWYLWRVDPNRQVALIRWGRKGNYQILHVHGTSLTDGTLEAELDYATEVADAARERDPATVEWHSGVPA